MSRLPPGWLVTREFYLQISQFALRIAMPA
jgi:hypothetical protein